MTVGIVIFARMDSSRLPGKALKPLAGRPLLAWTIERCGLADTDNSVFLATSDRPLDDPIADLAKDMGLPVFRGHAADVLGRAQAAAKNFGLETLVRISGDSPFIAPDLITRVITVHQDQIPDLTTNVHPRTLPPGISAEAISVEALARIIVATHTPEDREHVTRYIYANPKTFRIVNITASDLGYDVNRLDGLHLAVDTPTDYARACWIADRLENWQAGLNDIIDLAQAHDMGKGDIKEQAS